MVVPPQPHQSLFSDFSKEKTNKPVMKPLVTAALQIYRVWGSRMCRRPLSSCLAPTCLKAREDCIRTLSRSHQALAPGAWTQAHIRARRGLSQGRGSEHQWPWRPRPALPRSRRTGAAELSRIRARAGGPRSAPRGLHAWSCAACPNPCPSPPRPVHCSRKAGAHPEAARRGTDRRGGPGSRGPAEESGGPDGCRRGSQGWMWRKTEASSSLRPLRLCLSAPYGLKVSDSRME